MSDKTDGESFVLPAKRKSPERWCILQDASNLACGERDADYGPPKLNLTAAGALKTVFREHMVRDISLAELEAIELCLTKLGRIATGAPKRDNYVDAAAYIAIAGEIALDNSSDL